MRNRIRCMVLVNPKCWSRSFFLKCFIFIFNYAYLNMGLYTWVQCSKKSEKGAGSPGAAWCGCWNQTHGPQRSSSMILTLHHRSSPLTYLVITRYRNETTFSDIQSNILTDLHSVLLTWSLVSIQVWKQNVSLEIKPVMLEPRLIPSKVKPRALQLSQ